MRNDRRAPRLDRALSGTLFAAALVLLTLATAGACPPVAGATAQRALCQAPLIDLSPAERTARLTEMAAQLKARWLRVDVSWARAEPQQGIDNEAYLQAVYDTVAEARALGLKPLVMVLRTPTWAQDQSLWVRPPGGYVPGVPYAFYAIDLDHIPDFQAFMSRLTQRLGAHVNRWECWNEPNLWPYIWPQTTADDPYFAVRRYVAMLKAFNRGVKAVDPDDLVVAGSTGPVGNNDVYRTSPQRWASTMKVMGAADHFDIYSHHPYTPGGSTNIRPDEPPNDPLTTVTLYNLGQLLRLFPGKNFYLTEYGYNTEPCDDFGGFAVTLLQQARFLRIAYAYAGRYDQVRNLFWYLVQDVNGVYTGLRKTTGWHKPSWFVFAGGNTVGIYALPYVHPGTQVRVRGRIACETFGPVPERTVKLQGRRLGVLSWTTLASRTTDAEGRYLFTPTIWRPMQYRVKWPEVKTSDVRTVRVY
jgi:hypothetical protein